MTKTRKSCEKPDEPLRSYPQVVRALDHATTAEDYKRLFAYIGSRARAPAEQPASPVSVLAAADFSTLRKLTPAEVRTHSTRKLVK